MNLEDHLGDVIRKARAMSGVSADAAAKAAGLTTTELAALEESGNAVERLNFAALAPLIGLHAGKLEALAHGWRPAIPDLGRWRELRQISTTRGGNTVNCYLVWDEVSREAAVFDTGWEAQPVLTLIEENQLQLRHLFLTHTHEDHIAGLAGIREKFPKVRLHSSSKSAPVEQRNRANDFIHLGSLRITNRDTPGHAEDGVTYVIGNWSEDAPHAAIVGDAIFAGSIGRGNQSWDLAKQKILEQIFTLPAETLICPGHGPFTTVAEETLHNPFFVRTLTPGGEKRSGHHPSAA
ncbi:MAG: MBL fold metallo-hydrolase [Verrucomicrobia bacterium]|nr:MBL fold metallo-hydrolase [Verrucomicrobiota bacterium]